MTHGEEETDTSSWEHQNANCKGRRKQSRDSQRETETHGEEETDTSSWELRKREQQWTFDMERQRQTSRENSRRGTDKNS